MQNKDDTKFPYYLAYYVQKLQPNILKDLSLSLTIYCFSYYPCNKAALFSTVKLPALF